MISGFSFLIRLPTLNQLNGLMELMATLISRPSGGASCDSCVVPGNRKPGYCNEKVYIVTLWPLSWNAFARRSLKVAMPPPRSGYAGPMMMIFFFELLNVGIDTRMTLVRRIWRILLFFLLKLDNLITLIMRVWRIFILIHYLLFSF